MKVVVRRWLAGHASTLLDRWAQVGWNLDRIRYDDLSGAILLRRQLAMGRVVEAGVRHAEHEAPRRRQYAPSGAQQWLNRRHVHKRHVSDHGVEASLAQRQQLPLLVR